MTKRKERTSLQPVQAVTAIEVEHLSKHYDELEAVHDIGFTVASGSCTAFLGPNGAGKTTIIKTLYGKAKADPNPETRISVLGYEMPRRELEAKSLIGLVPQDDSLDEELDVEQNLSIFARFYHLGRKQALERIDALLRFMELHEKRRSRVKELSGGMKRRLVIARALLGGPRLLILDEPTTGLDPQVRQLIWDRLRALMMEGVTILLTTHYMDEAFQIADDIIIMDKGRKMLQGPPRGLMEKHMETHVLEVRDPADLERNESVKAAIAGFERSGGLRRDGSSVRTLLYSSDRAMLDGIAETLRPGSFLLRETNLEDLFLKTTGRALNE
jgi:lipooligosaccharide transport system ATP-binding protein